MSRNNHTHLLKPTIPLLFMLLLSVACGTFEVGIEQSTITPQNQVVTTTTAEPTTAVLEQITPPGPNATPISSVTLSPIDTDPQSTVDPGHALPTPDANTIDMGGMPPTRTPYVFAAGLDLTRSLYFLAATRPTSSGENRGVWRLDPGSSEVTRITSPELDITAFDIWPGDGRMSYGTESGQLYIDLPHQEPRLIHDGGRDIDEVITISSVAWSPEGARLVFTALRQWTPETIAGEADGLWLLDLRDDRLLKLLDNRPARWQGDDLDVSELRTFADPVWSPDGAALMLTANYWEWSDILLLEPVAPDPSELNLRDPAEGWPDGSWSIDGRSLLLSGEAYSSTADLARAGRDGQDLELLLDGEAERLYIHDAQELPAGLTFLASPEGDPKETKLYLGHQTEAGFGYALAGLARALCNTGFPVGINWEPDGQTGVLTCSQGAYLISLDGSIDLDLAPFLGQLAAAEQLKVYWGQ